MDANIDANRRYMKRLILSRKGFDSSYGGVASPIFEDGRMLSLPIPEAGGTYQYGELSPGGVNLGALVPALTDGKISASDRAHLDPDLDHSAVRRVPGWRPAFGQAGGAAAHLCNQGVGPGDLFLFFGWFRRVETVGGVPHYVRDAPDLHVLFGWLQVAEVVQPSSAGMLPGLERHPHFSAMPRSGNHVYLADSPTGGGIFSRYAPDLQLTAPGCSRSCWRLPGWFDPASRSPLTYHGDLKRWLPDGEWVYLNSASPGQEFVLDLEEYPEARDWIEVILGYHTEQRELDE